MFSFADPLFVFPLVTDISNDRSRTRSQLSSKSKRIRLEYMLARHELDIVFVTVSFFCFLHETCMNSGVTYTFQDIFLIRRIPSVEITCDPYLLYIRCPYSKLNSAVSYMRTKSPVGVITLAGIIQV